MRLNGNNVNLPNSSNDGSYNANVSPSSTDVETVKSQASTFFFTIGFGLVSLISGNINHGVVYIHEIESNSTKTIDVSNNGNVGGFDMGEIDKVNQGQFSEYKAHIDTRFDGVEQRFDRVDQALNDVKSVLTDVEKNMVTKDNLMTEIRVQSWKKLAIFASAALAIWKLFELVLAFLQSIIPLL